MCVSDMFDLFGSSPLVRGQRGTRTTYPAHIRIIPARAGPTYGTNPRKSDTTDHPRSCGANGTVSGVNQRQHGSSPLVRGQHAVRGKHRLPGRIIPARAGPTRRWAKCTCNRSDHPRSCGANNSVAVMSDVPPGSSPLVRGQQSGVIVIGHQIRIIPARAGPTYGTTPRKSDTTDHPRSCGANDIVVFLTKTCHGSSPLVRGQLTSRLILTLLVRIIPARAGPTRTKSWFL